MPTMMNPTCVQWLSLTNQIKGVAWVFYFDLVSAYLITWCLLAKHKYNLVQWSSSNLIPADLSVTKLLLWRFSLYIWHKIQFYQKVKHCKKLFLYLVNMGKIMKFGYRSQFFWYFFIQYYQFISTWNFGSSII